MLLCFTRPAVAAQRGNSRRAARWTTAAVRLRASARATGLLSSHGLDRESEKPRRSP